MVWVRDHIGYSFFFYPGTIQIPVTNLTCSEQIEKKKNVAKVKTERDAREILYSLNQNWKEGSQATE